MRQYALSHHDLTIKLAELESRFDRQFADVFEAISFLINKDELYKAQRERK